MNIRSIINRKRLKEQLSYKEIEYAMKGFLNNDIPDYQMSSLLMAIAINGLDEQEIMDFTDVIINCCQVKELNNYEYNIVDKISVGGISDNVSLILASLVASCDTKFAKIDFSSSGYNDGIIDKVESISGFTPVMSIQEYDNQINNVGVVIGKIDKLIPVYSRIYKLCDITSTLSSIPLFVSMMMSKEIIGGVNKVLIEINIGQDELIKNIGEAKLLSETFIKIGKKYNVEVICILIDMNAFLGNSLGNSLEIKEAIETLQGNGPKDLTNMVVAMGSYLISMDKKIPLEKSKDLVIQNIKNGNAYNKFLELVKKQQGNINDIPISNKVFSIKSSKTGFVTKIDTKAVENIIKQIGAGRKELADAIDHTVGMVLSKKVGDYVIENEELAKVYLNKIDLSLNQVLSCFEIGETLGQIEPLIKEIIK
ncbi:MAG: thymidine phosphorylase [Firmicutes bacterium]|nr:thymidine phosphorylase [Bacillota bacterium]